MVLRPGLKTNACQLLAATRLIFVCSVVPFYVVNWPPLLASLDQSYQFSHFITILCVISYSALLQLCLHVRFPFLCDGCLYLKFILISWIIIFRNASLSVVKNDCAPRIASLRSRMTLCLYFVFLTRLVTYVILFILC